MHPAVAPVRARFGQLEGRNRNPKYAWRALASMENTQAMTTAQVVVRRHGADRIRRGHLWVYRSDVLDAKDAEPGAIVSVREERGGIVGEAFYSSKSQIALRFLTRGPAVINEEFLRRRFTAAHNFRARMGVDPNLSRRIYSESDLLPGLIVDRYGDYLVVQSLVQAIDRLQPVITSILQEQYRPRSIIFRNDIRVRELEALPLVSHWIGEQPPDAVIVDEDGKQVELRLSGGQKTGTYLDQRETHRAARRYARGKVLDCFTYGGGFALQVAELSESVEAVDISTEAVQLAQGNAERNALHNIHCIEANVFDYLRQSFKAGTRYDMIILDPPAFAKSKDSLE